MVHIVFRRHVRGYRDRPFGGVDGCCVGTGPMPEDQGEAVLAEALGDGQAESALGAGEYGYAFSHR
jgi:hypothetical protein